MKRYNRDARASLKNATRKQARVTRTRHHQHSPSYGGYNHTTYISEFARNPRDTHAGDYVKIVNAITTLTTPTLTHLPTAPYRKFTLAPPTDPLTRPEPPTPTPITDTRTVKAIIYDHTGTRRLWYGYIRRTRTIMPTSVHITLHRNRRTLSVHPYTPPYNLLPYTHAELCAFQVETYKLP